MESAEVYALRVNHREIIETISRDLSSFKLQFVQEGFIRSLRANDIMSKLGISDLDKAGQLFESFQTLVENCQSDKRREVFKKFVEMLEREPTTKDLGETILHCYENPKLQRVPLKDRQRHYTLYYAIGFCALAVLAGLYGTHRYQENKRVERKCAKLHQDNMNTCLELGENFGIGRKTLEEFRNSNLTPEEVCQKMLDLWTDDISGNDDGLSMSGLLNIQKKLGATELRADLKRKFSESRKKQPECYDDV